MTDTLLKITVFVVGIPLFGWLLLSPLIFIWWFFDTDTRDRFALRHEKLTMAVYAGTFFCLVFVLGEGIEELLVFIPADWGEYNEDGDFVTTRNSIAYALAFFLSLLFVDVSRKFDEMRTENERLSVLTETQKRKDGLRHRSREALIRGRDETETKLKELRERSYSGRLSSGDYRELRVLEELLDEFDCRIRKTKPPDALEEE